MAESTTIISTDARSELERWRDAKKDGTPRVVDAPSESVAETPAADVVAAPVEDDGPPVEAPETLPDKPTKTDRWQDPETGEVLDMRRRSSRRIQKLTEKVRALESQIAARPERQADAPRTASLPAAGARQAADSGPSDPEPQEANYPNDWPKFIADRAAWMGRQEARKFHEQQTAEREAAAFAESYKKDQEAYRGRATEFAKTRPDFREKTAAVVASDVMFHAVFASEHGPRIAYFLGSHPDVAKQLAQETQSYGAGDMPFVRRHLEAISAPPVAPDAVVRPVSNAPAPIKPLTGTATVDPTPKPASDMSLAEWRAQKKRRAG